jgi:hypothetical protein
VNAYSKVGLGELHDELFLTLIGASRRCPLVPNGMSRKQVYPAIKESKKAVPRLDPKDFPTRKKALKLPSGNKSLSLSMVSKDATHCIISSEMIDFSGLSFVSSYSFRNAQDVRFQKMSCCASTRLW